MPKLRALAILVLLLSYGAVGARQPAVRVSVPLPAPASSIAAALTLPDADRSRIVLDIIRVVFDAPEGVDVRDAQLRARLSELAAAGAPGETVMLPLDPSIWRETVFGRDVPDPQIIAAILATRQTALLYHGLAALDDETLGWLGAERDVLSHLLRHAGPFSAFAPGLRIKGGRVLVPGGAAAEPIWERVVGAAPDRPAAFVRRLFSASRGRVAAFYDAVSQLDEPRQRFALGLGGSTPTPDRARSLARAFERWLEELPVGDRPFSKHPVDPALALALIAVTDDATMAGPAERALWQAVFKRDDSAEPVFSDARTDGTWRGGETAAADAAWLVSRLHSYSSPAARRRLDAVLFAQRVFATLEPGQQSAAATALRGVLSFPALMLTLERIGITSPATLADAAVRAHALSGIENATRRRDSIRLFQVALAVIDRAALTGAIDRSRAQSLVSSLVGVAGPPEGIQTLLSGWIRERLVPELIAATGAPSPDEAVLAALAGHRPGRRPGPIVEWEGRQYRVEPELADFARMRRVREQQQTASLDEALRTASSNAGTNGPDRRAAATGPEIADILTSMLYIALIPHQGGRMAAGGDPALRHEIVYTIGMHVRPLSAWRFAEESFSQEQGWQLRGSLLGLDIPLARFALRRLDLSAMPPAPRLTSAERQTAALAAAWMRPRDLSDAARDEIAAAVKRGTARVAALESDREELERVARDAGLSAWRREALGWLLAHEPAAVAAQFSPLELLWLGLPGTGVVAGIDAWGAPVAPLTGCLRLEMPRPLPWEALSGRPSVGLLATLAADVGIVLARELAARELPASMAAGLAGLVMQEVLDGTLPAYLGDWSQFGRTAHTLSRDTLDDYISALAAGGPLVPVETRTEGGRP